MVIARRCALALLFASSNGCGVLTGLDEPYYVADGGSVASGSGGGGGAVCGDGHIDPDEECDDPGAAAAELCDASCHVVCSGPGEFKDLADHPHCYQYDDGTARTWTEARVYCHDAWGGYLAAITTEAERQLALLFVKEDTWTGGNDIRREGTWAWVDTNEAWTDELWWPEEPNGGELEDCVGLHDDADDGSPDIELADFPCDKALWTLCERDPPGKLP